MNCVKCYLPIDVIVDNYTQVGIGFGLREYYHDSCYKKYVKANAVMPIGKAIKSVRIEKGVY